MFTSIDLVIYIYFTYISVSFLLYTMFSCKKWVSNHFIQGNGIQIKVILHCFEAMTYLGDTNVYLYSCAGRCCFPKFIKTGFVWFYTDIVLELRSAVLEDKSINQSFSYDRKRSGIKGFEYI